jgi:hypothetical protein
MAGAQSDAQNAIDSLGDPVNIFLEAKATQTSVINPSICRRLSGLRQFFGTVKDTYPAGDACQKYPKDGNRCKMTD